MNRDTTEARPGLDLRIIGSGVFLLTVAGFVRAPLLPDMGRDLDMSPGALGGFISVFALGRILADIPAGRLTDRRPARTMLAMAGMVIGAASLMAGFAPTAAVAFVASFALGVGSSWTNTTGIAAFATAPHHRRGVAMSGFAAALMVGQAFGPAVGGTVASAWDWRGRSLLRRRRPGGGHRAGPRRPTPHEGARQD